MKKLLTASTWAALLIMQISVYAAPDAPVEVVPIDALLPEVAEIVLHPEPPDAAKLRQNAYVGLLAMDAPEGMDYMAIGSEFVINDFNKFSRAMAEMDYELLHQFNDINNYDASQESLSLATGAENSSSCFFPCMRLSASEFLTQVVSQKERINTEIHGKALLLERYAQIRQLPDYTVSQYSPPYYYLSHIHTWRMLSNLRLAQAILAFDEGNADQGFAILQEEMAFAKRALSSNGGLIHHIWVRARLYVIYHVIDSMLDAPLLRPYLQDERLAVLLGPLSEVEQKSIARAFEHQRNSELYMFYTLNNKAQGAGLERLAGVIFQGAYNRYATTNIAYLMYQPVIDRASLSMEQASALYVQGTRNNFEAEMQGVMEKQSYLLEVKNGAFFNIAGKQILLFVQQLANYSTAEPLDKFYDLQIYMALISAKHQIIQAGVGADDVVAFLQNAGASGRNPYTQESFQWDAVTRTLSTPCLHPKSFIVSDEKHIAVHIEMEMEK